MSKYWTSNQVKNIQHHKLKTLKLNLMMAYLERTVFGPQGDIQKLAPFPELVEALQQARVVLHRLEVLAVDRQVGIRRGRRGSSRRVFLEESSATSHLEQKMDSIEQSNKEAPSLSRWQHWSRI